MTQYDLKTVINTLEHCKNRDYENCVNCPGRDCAIEIAIRILESQIPRVMSVKEALKSHTCWIETNGWNGEDLPVPVLRCEKYDDDVCFAWVDMEDDLYVFPKTEYNKTVRCWTAKPTDKQRGNTPWLRDS